jgi:hypothetical protein
MAIIFACTLRRAASSCDGGCTVLTRRPPGLSTPKEAPGHIEICGGLWVSSRRTLPFNQVTGVELTEGILQQTRGAGTVMLVTRGTGAKADQEGPASGGETRVALGDVPDPREVYDLIRTLVLRKSGAEQAAADGAMNVKPPSQG